MKPILALETSTSRCGVALLLQHNGAQQTIVREVDGVAGHAESLLPLVNEVLSLAEITREQLGAIAFGQGPGAFTGLRVACGVAQGLGYALNIPVVPVGSLLAIAAAMPSNVGIRVVALDARMNEIYLAAWVQTASHTASETLGLSVLQPPVLIAANDVLTYVTQRLPFWLKAPSVSSQVGLSGNGWALLGEPTAWLVDLKQRCATFALASVPNVTLCDANAIPTVHEVAKLGVAAWQAGKGLRPEQAAPFYLRDKVAFTSVERAQGMGGNPKAGDGAPDLACLLLPMLPNDLDEVVELEHLSQSFPWSKQNFKDALEAGYPAWVVRQGQTLVGFCVGMLAPDDVHVLVIAVHPDHRRKGLGALLLHAVRQLAIQSAISRVLLEVRPSNQKAVAFYHQLGFERIGLRKGYYPAGKTAREDAWVLAVAVDHFLKLKAHA